MMKRSIHLIAAGEKVAECGVTDNYDIRYRTTAKCFTTCPACLLSASLRENRRTKERSREERKARR